MNSAASDEIIQYIANNNSPKLTISDSPDSASGDILKFECKIPISHLFYSLFLSSTLAERDLVYFIINNKNQTQNAIVFHEFQEEILAYTVLFNNSRFLFHVHCFSDTVHFLIPMARRVAEKTTETVIRAIDEAFYSVNMPDSSKIDITISSMGFPATKPRFLTSSGLCSPFCTGKLIAFLLTLPVFPFLVVQIIGPVFFYCPPMFLFILLLNEIVDEKQKKLRQGMKVMGLSVFLLPFSSFFEYSSKYSSSCLNKGLYVLDVLVHHQ